MTILGSHAPEEFHTDTHPYLVTRKGVEGREMVMSITQDTTKFAPRPEFIPTLAHDHNPILVQFGRTVGRVNLYGDECAEWVLRTRDVDQWAEGWTAEQAEHAGRVLLRLHRYIRFLERTGALA